MRGLFVTAVLASVALVACGRAAGSGSTKRGPTGFEPGEENVEDRPSVFLREHPTDGPIADAVELDVVARRVADVHGIALRLTWDPAALAFDRAALSTRFSSSAFAQAREGTPGQLALVWTEKGAATTVDASDEAILGSVRFRRLGPAGSPVSLRAERSAVVGRSGRRADVAWFGGTVVARPTR